MNEMRKLMESIKVSSTSKKQKPKAKTYETKAEKKKTLALFNESLKRVVKEYKEYEPKESSFLEYAEQEGVVHPEIFKKNEEFIQDVLVDRFKQAQDKDEGDTALRIYHAIKNINDMLRASLNKEFNLHTMKSEKDIPTEDEDKLFLNAFRSLNKETPDIAKKLVKYNPGLMDFLYHLKDAIDKK